MPDIAPSLRSPLSASLPLHISLSRTLQIKTDRREDFLETLTSSLRKSAVSPFDVRFASLKWVPNFERNRWFLVLGIEKPPSDELNRLLESCNAASEKCGHPGLYTGGEGDGPMDQGDLRSAKRRRMSSAKGAVAGEAYTPERVDRTGNFHISIAWNLVEPAPEWVELAQSIDVSKLLKPPQTTFDAVKAKVGNAVHSIHLGPKVRSAKTGSGILGLG